MEKDIKILIIGTKSFDDYSFFEEKLYKKLEKYFEEGYNIILREQGTTITDKFVKLFSKENNCTLEEYPIQWKEFGNKAEIKNIQKIIWGENAKEGVDILLTFQDKWDGEQDKYLLKRVIEEFKSIINFDFFNPHFYYSYTK